MGQATVCCTGSILVVRICRPGGGIDLLRIEPFAARAADQTCIDVGHRQRQDRLSQIIAGALQLHHQRHVRRAPVHQREREHQAHDIARGEIARDGGFEVPAHLFSGQLDRVVDLSAQFTKQVGAVADQVAQVYVNFGIQPRETPLGIVGGQDFIVGRVAP